jgi:hypothetical protein
LDAVYFFLETNLVSLILISSKGFVSARSTACRFGSNPVNHFHSADYFTKNASSDQDAVRRQ